MVCRQAPFCGLWTNRSRPQRLYPSKSCSPVVTELQGCGAVDVGLSTAAQAACIHTTIDAVLSRTMAAMASTTSLNVSIVGPLTSLFTPSSSCLTGLWAIGDPSSGDWYNQLGPVSTSDCLPPGYHQASFALYSPGVCPSGYSRACSEVVSDGSFSDVVATCCPRLDLGPRPKITIEPHH